MKKLSMPLIVGLIFILGVAVIAQAVYLSRINREIQALKDEVQEVRDRPAPVAARGDAREETGRPARREDPADPADPDRPAEAEEDDAAVADARLTPEVLRFLPPELEETLAALVEETVEQKLEEKKAEFAQEAEKKKKPPLGELVAELQIDPVIESEMEQIINQGKDEMFDLLTMPREDGGNFVDDFIGLLGSEEPEEAGRKLWVTLITERIPGTEETYIQRILEVQDRVNMSFESMMSADQWKTYKQKQLDPLEIQTGHDPFAEYVRERGIQIPQDDDNQQ
ncbi:MAG: hypothetical protein ACYTAF_10975 [Planctomycetota bacterium]|jgi:hypothetical protein